MDLVDIGLRVHDARKARKLSQAALAQSLGMSRATISAIENGTVPEIGIRKILALCTVLGLELSVQEKSKRPTLQTLMKEGLHG